MPPRRKQPIRKQQPKRGIETISLNKSLVNYCGPNWATELQSVTGAMFHIDMPLFKSVLQTIDETQRMIKTCLETVEDPSTQLIELRETFVHVCDDYDIPHKAIYMKKRPGKPDLEEVAPEYMPIAIVKTEWFSLIKHIEKELYDLISRIFISSDGEHSATRDSKLRSTFVDQFPYSKLQSEIEVHPQILELHRFCDMRLDNPQFYTSLLVIHDYLNKVINIILTPMYDVQAKVTRSYEKDLARAFKPYISKGEMTKDLVIGLLVQFTIAQYRCQLTGNQKYYMQLVTNEITDGQISKMDGPRFIEVMDSVNMEELDPKSKTAGFAVKAKAIMKKMIELPKDSKITDLSGIIQEVKTLMNGSDEIKAALPEAVQSELKSLDDLLG